MASDIVPEAEVCFLRGWPPGVLVPGGGAHTPGEGDGSVEGGKLVPAQTAQRWVGGGGGLVAPASVTCS